MKEKNFTRMPLTKNSLPPLESYITSATERRGGAMYDDMLVRSSRYGESLVEDLAANDCKDNELPKALCTLSLDGL